MGRSFQKWMKNKEQWEKELKKAIRNDDELTEKSSLT